MGGALALATVPAVLALVNLAKETGLPSKLGPLAALIFGVACSAAVAIVEHQALAPAILSGIVLGLGASGLYDATKPSGGGAPGE